MDRSPLSLLFAPLESRSRPKNRSGGLLTGAGYATTVTSVYGGCAPAQHAFASADGTGALAGGFNSLFGKAQA